MFFHSCKSPAVWFLTALFLLPFFYLSPDGRESYLWDRWDYKFVIFLLNWTLFYFFLLRWKITKSFSRSLAQMALMIGSTYLVCVIISFFLWNTKREGFIKGTIHAMIQDPELMIRNRPFYRFTGLSFATFRSAEDHTVSVDLDSEGFRNPSPNPDKIDVGFIGDSFTFAAQVNWNELFSTIASKDLNLLGENYGINGTSQGTQLQVLKKFVLPKHPKVVVLQLFDNDPADNLRFLKWKKSGATRVDEQRWSMGRSEFDQENPFSSIFTLKLPLQMVKKELFRPSQRAAGFQINFKAKQIHFYADHSYKNKLLIRAEPALVDKIFLCPSKTTEANACGNWVVQCIREYYPSAVFDAEKENEFYLNTLLESIELLATRDLIDEFITTCKLHGSEVIVLRISSAWMTYHSRLKPIKGSPMAYFEMAETHFPGINNFDRTIGGLCRTRNIPYISTLNTWKEAEDFYYWRYEAHLNHEGHRSIAATLKPEILKAINSKKTGF